MDIDRERARLAGEVERLEGHLKRLEAKLANDNFVTKAPAEVVRRERDKAAEAVNGLATLRRRVGRLGEG